MYITNQFPLTPAQETIKNLQKFVTSPTYASDAERQIQQESYSQKLWETIQNYHPKNKESFFQRIWLQFTRVLQWVLRRPLTPSIDELKLRYGMNLFKNFEPSLQDSRESGYNLPFSVALEFFCNSIKSAPNRFGIPERQLNALMDCVGLAKELEALKKGSYAFRKWFLEGLTQKINAKIEALKEDEEIYIPGGYEKYVQGKQTDGFIPEGNRNHMIYQIRKDPDRDNVLLFTVYNNSTAIDLLMEGKQNEEDNLKNDMNLPYLGIKSGLQYYVGKGSSVVTYEMSKSELQEQLFSLLEVQTAPYKEYRLGWFTSLSQKLQGIFNDAKSTLPNLADFSVNRLASFFQRYKDKIVYNRGDSYKHSHRSEPVELLEIFSKIHFNHNEKFRQILQKTELFLDIYHNLKNKLHQENVRKWLNDSIFALLKSYKKFFTLEPKESIVRYFSNIVDEINKAEKRTTFSYPPGPFDQTSNPTLFEDSMQFEPIIKPCTIEISRRKQHCDDKFVFQKIPEGNFAEKLKFCKSLLNTAHLEDLWLCLQYLHSTIEQLDSTNYFDNLKDEEAEVWSRNLYDMVMLTTQVHFELNKPGPTGCQILHLLQAIKICQRLAINNDRKTCFSSFCLDMDVVKDVLKDSYLDLGTEGSKIHDCIHAIEEAGEIRLDLVNPNHEDKLLSLADQEFFRHYRKKNEENFKDINEKDKNSFLEEDFGFAKGKLATQVIHLRLIKLMAHSMIAKYRCLGSPSLIMYLKDAFRTFLGAIDKNLSNPEIEFVKYKINWINEKCKGLNHPLYFKKKKYLFVNRRTVNIAGSELDYNPYDKPVIDNVISPFANKRIDSQYKDMGPFVPKPMAKHIIEACLTKTEGDPVDENGTPLKPSIEYIVNGQKVKEWSDRDRTHHVATGDCHTESYVRSDYQNEMGLHSDVWSDLKCMQTQPFATRISNTLATFLRYPSLLGISKDCLAWQWIFSLNLFRNNALACYLNEKPQHVSILIKDLSRLATLMESSNDVRGMLYIAHLTAQIRTVINNIKLSSVKNDHKLKSLLTVHRKKIKKWMASSDKKRYKPHTRAIHQTFLLIHAELLKGKLADPLYNPHSDEKKHQLFLELLRSYFVIRQTPQPYNERNFAHEEYIAQMMHRLFPVCRHLLNDINIRTKFLNKIVPGNKNADWLASDEFLCYEKCAVKIDLRHGLLYTNNVASGPLPDLITHDPLFYNMFGSENIHNIQCEHSHITYEGVKGERYAFQYNQIDYRIFVLPDRKPFIYKKTMINGEKWCILHQPISSGKHEEDLTTLIKRSLFNSGETKLPSSKEQQALPLDLFQHNCWASTTGDDFLIEDNEGNCLYTGKFALQGYADGVQVKRVQSLSKHKGESFHTILNPWKNKAFERFLALCPPNQVLAKGAAQNKVDEIKYLNFKLHYTWDAKTRRWECPSIPGYYLSSNKIATLFLTDKDKINEFFDVNFSHYHLLEHPTKPARLILPSQEFKKLFNSKENFLLKNNQCIPIPANDESSPANVLYQFTVDPLGTVKGTPEGYFYLAYLLYTQSKYKEAIYYLKKAQDIKPELSSECQKILEWMHKWDASTLDAKLFMIHVDLLILDQSPTVEKTPKLNKIQKKLLLNLGLNYLWYDPDVEHLHLELSASENNKIKNYLDLVMEKHFDEFDKDLIAQFSNSIKIQKKDLTKDHGSKLNEIKSEIKNLNATLMARSLNFKAEPLEQKDKSNYYAYVFPELQNRLTQGQNLRYNFELEKHLPNLDQTFNNREKSLVQEIGSELVRDIWRAVTEQQAEKNVLTINYNGISIIENILSDDAKKLSDQIRVLKDKIIQQIPDLSLPPRKSLELSWDTALNYIKEPTNFKFLERQFDAVLYATASEDWLNLDFALKDTVIVNELVREYLSKKTVWQQHRRALDLIHQYKLTRSLKIKNRLGELLSTRQCYRPETDPNAVAILLLESELGIIARKSQIDHFRIMINEEDIFKQEALAGGKTTFLRNLISEYKANGIGLSCVITHEPLISIHHKQLETAATEAYGAKAYRFEFNRQHPTDTFSLYVILRNLLKIILEKGRLDFTPNDILSLHHAFLLKHTELENPVRDVNEIHDEIDILAEIIQTFKGLGTVYSDEFDKILEANKQHNYSIGKPQKINNVKSRAGMQITEWVLSNNKYRHLFKTNQLWTKQKDPAYIQGFLTSLATNVFEELLKSNEIKETQRAQFIQYLTQQVIDDPEQPEKEKFREEMSAFREKVINRLPSETYQTVKAYHKFLQKIIPTSFGKRNGLGYIRSEDGVLVKPATRNGVCNEISEFGSEEESIWYTCLNYMHSIKEEDVVGGVTEEQIAQLVLDTHHQSSRHILRNIKEHSTSNLNYSQTHEAEEFKENFGISLVNVVPEDYPGIAKTINEDPNLLARFLKNYVFPKLEISPQQIVGTPHHLVPMFHHISGSAGTSNTYRTLPKQIKALEQYYKQPGVDGSVYLALLTDFKKGVYDLNDPNSKDQGQTFILYDQTQSISRQFAQLLQKEKGSTLIDCAPAFPGMTADKITLSLAKHMPDARLRYTDKEDQEIIIDTATGSSSPDGEILLEDAHAIMDNAQRRGTHKELPDLSVGYVPVNTLTTLTDFSQSAMRMRKFGKGQKSRIVIDQQTYAYLKEQPDPMNFITMLCNNEASFLMTQHHDKSEVQMIRAMRENAVYDELLALKNRELRGQVWSKCRSFFIKDTQEPLEELDNSVLKCTSIVLSEIALYEEKQLEAFIKHLKKIDSSWSLEPIQRLKRVKEELALYAKKKTTLNPHYFSKYMSSNKFNIDMHYSVQKDLYVNADKEQELELNKENLKPNYNPFVLEWKDLKDVSNLDSLLECLKNPSNHWDSGLYSLKEYVPFYDSNLFFTHNVYRPEQKILPWGGSSAQQPLLPLPDGQARINKLAIVVDRHGVTPKVYGIIGSLTDFDEFLGDFDKQAKENKNVDYYICNIFKNDELEGYLTDWNNFYYDSETQEMISKLIMQAKLLGGEIHLQESELFDFKKWLVEICSDYQINPAELEKALLSYLLSRRPSLCEQYDKSLMAKGFHYCKKHAFTQSK